MLLLFLSLIGNDVFLFTVEEFLKEVHKQLSTGAQGVHAIPTGLHIRDDEQVKSFILAVSN